MTYNQRQSVIDKIFRALSAITVFACVMMGVVGGCAENRSETRLTMEKVVELAQSGNVQGKLKVRMSGMQEVGLKEGFYMGSEGTFIEGDLEYRFSDKPTTQPSE